MPVDAIGSSLASGNVSNNSSISQEDFIRLFLAQLNFQDPLEPMDNGEFLSQMAQFSGLEQSRINGQHLENLSFLDSVDQGASLLGKTVEFSSQGINEVGRVTTVTFTSAGPRIAVSLNNGQVVTDISLSKITLIRE